MIMISIFIVVILILFLLVYILYLKKEIKKNNKTEQQIEIIEQKQLDLKQKIVCIRCLDEICFIFYGDGRPLLIHKTSFNHFYSKNIEDFESIIKNDNQYQINNDNSEDINYKEYKNYLNNKSSLSLKSHISNNVQDNCDTNNKS